MKLPAPELQLLPPCQKGGGEEACWGSCAGFHGIHREAALLSVGREAEAALP